MKTERSAGLIVVRETDGRREFLLVRSRRHGAWGFPKGHLNPGESDEAAALRETAEEVGLTGLEIVPGFGETLRYPLPDGTALKESVYLLARAAPDSQPTSGDADEIAELRWAAFDRALALLTFDNSRELLRKAGDFLASGR